MAQITVTIPSSFEGDILPAVKEAVQKALPSIASFVLDRMGQFADQKLHSSASDYRRGFGPESLIITDTGFGVEPTTELAKALEEGYDAFDIKHAMLSSDNVKTSKDGSRYIDVPFRHGASEKSTRLQGMPSDVKRLVDNAMSRERRGAKREGREVSQKSRVIGTLKPKTPHWKDLKYGESTAPHVVEHKTSLYSGMMRTGSRGQTQYKTIRCISDKSGPESWMHPGFPGVHGIPRVMDALEKTAIQVISQEIRKMGLGVK